MEDDKEGEVEEEDTGTDELDGRAGDEDDEEESTSSGTGAALPLAAGETEN